MQDHYEGNNAGAKPEEVRAAIRGWALLGTIVAVVFGAAYALIEM